MTTVGQNQDANWYFGDYAGIHFSEGEPVDITPGPFDVDEGSGTISDENGNLLFSTNGEVVFDSNNNPMPNGTVLAGNSSSTQNVLIVPFPGDQENRLFYIFTVAAQVNYGEPENTGLEYVVIDMTENNGLGDVVQISTELLPNTTEKIHATYHANQRDVWLVVHELGSDAFYAYLITCEGIGEPVVSNTGFDHHPGLEALGSLGAHKISPDGATIASTFTQQSQVPFLAFLEVGDFDNSTGVVEITESITKETAEYYHGYGLEFSPDNSRLYWSLLSPTLLYQYSFDADPLLDSEVLISEGDISAYAGMQLGPDGRIYIARTNGAAYLSRIENPNAEGSDIILTDEAVPLTNLSKLGLPNNWMYPYPEPTVVPEETTVNVSFCAGGSVELAPEIDNAESYLWNTGESTLSIVVSEPGFYTVEMEVGCEIVAQNFLVESITPPWFEISPERSLCEGDSLLISIETDENVLWGNGHASPTIFVSEPGHYDFSVSNDFCTVDESVEVLELKLPGIEAPDQIEKCFSRNGVFNPLLSNTDSLFINDQYSDVPVSIDSEETISVLATNRCGSTQKFVHVEAFDCNCNFFVPNAFTPNSDGVNDIFKPSLDCEPYQYNLKIFNRWGECVFETLEPASGWNGELKNSGYYAPDGVYAYQVEYAAVINGVISKENQSGHISLIR